MADEPSDALTYPILTEEVSLPATSSRGPRATPDSSGYGRTVENALRNILGWRIRDNDPKGFLAALKQSFDLTTVEGHTEWKWTPHTYAIEADMGAVTGAQAAIYSRARAALTQSLPLLDGLQTLLAVSDEQEVEAMTAIVRSSMSELVGELGQEGGPRLARIDEYFRLLLGDNPVLRDSEEVGGQLGLLRDALGLVRRNVNTIAEEQNLTNFLILVDYITSLRLTWNSQRHFFDRKGTDVFLGTQLVLLARTLAVIGEIVQEAYFVMDSVFLGPAERQVTKLDLGTGSPVFLGELLDWVETFALEEGPRLISQGGKDGVINAFAPTVQTLSNLIDRTAKVASQPSTNPSKGFHTSRVSAVMTDLAVQLHTTLTLADQVRRIPGPKVKTVDPQEIEKIADNNGQILRRLTISGGYFQPGAEVRLNLSGPRATEIRPVDNNVIFIHQAELKATFDFANAAIDSLWTVVVINPDKQHSRLKDALSVIEPQSMIPLRATPVDFFPQGLHNRKNQKLAVHGANFEPDMMVELQFQDGNLVEGTAVKVDASSNSIAATFDLSSIKPDQFAAVFVRKRGEYRVGAPGMLALTVKP